MARCRDNVIVLINEFRKHTCLYAVKSKEYKNKHARIKALNEIKTTLSEKKDYSVEEIKTKIHGLRTTFLTEHRKYLKLKKSGTGEDDIEIYYPTLWYYDLLTFLLDHNEVRPGKDNISIHEKEIIEAADTTLSLEDIMSEDLAIEFPESQNSQTKEDSSDEDIYELDQQTGVLKNVRNERNSFEILHKDDDLMPETKKRRVNKNIKTNKIDKTLNEASGAMKVLSEAIVNSNSHQKTAEVDEFQTFGQFVTQKLRKMSKNIAEDVQEEISTIIFSGLRKSRALSQ